MLHFFFYLLFFVLWFFSSFAVLSFYNHLSIYLFGVSYFRFSFPATPVCFYSLPYLSGVFGDNHQPTSASKKKRKVDISSHQSRTIDFYVHAGHEDSETICKRNQ